MCKMLLQVKTRRMHLFTTLQFAGFALLWVIKSSPIALAFPFFVVSMVPFRMMFKYIFTPAELEAVRIFSILFALKKIMPNFFAFSSMAITPEKSSKMKHMSPISTTRASEAEFIYMLYVIFKKKTV